MISLIMSATENVQHGSTGAVTVSRRLAKAIPELGRVQELLLSGKELNPRIFTDFRDALNHVRNTAWSAHQYIALKLPSKTQAVCFLFWQNVSVSPTSFAKLDKQI